MTSYKSYPVESFLEGHEYAVKNNKSFFIFDEANPTVYRYTAYYNFKALILENGHPLYVPFIVMFKNLTLFGPLYKEEIKRVKIGFQITDNNESKLMMIFHKHFTTQIHETLGVHNKIYSPIQMKYFRDNKVLDKPICRFNLYYIGSMPKNPIYKLSVVNNKIKTKAFKDEEVNIDNINFSIPSGSKLYGCCDMSAIIKSKFRYSIKSFVNDFSVKLVKKHNNITSMLTVEDLDEKDYYNEINSFNDF